MVICHNLQFACFKLLLIYHRKRDFCYTHGKFKKAPGRRNANVYRGLMYYSSLSLDIDKASAPRGNRVSVVASCSSMWLLIRQLYRMCAVITCCIEVTSPSSFSRPNGSELKAFLAYFWIWIRSCFVFFFSLVDILVDLSFIFRCLILSSFNISESKRCESAL